MELFDEAIKHFPEIEKHARYLFKKVPPEKRRGKWKNPLAAEMVEWIWDELLDDHSRLYHLFLQAGYTYKLDMSLKVFEWYLLDHCMKQSQKEVNRADTPPARK